MPRNRNIRSTLRETLSEARQRGPAGRRPRRRNPRPQNQQGGVRGNGSATGADLRARRDEIRSMPRGPERRAARQEFRADREAARPAIRAERRAAMLGGPVPPAPAPQNMNFSAELPREQVYMGPQAGPDNRRFSAELPRAVTPLPTGGVELDRMPEDPNAIRAAYAQAMADRDREQASRYAVPREAHGGYRPGSGAVPLQETVGADANGRPVTQPQPQPVQPQPVERGAPDVASAPGGSPSTVAPQAPLQPAPAAPMPSFTQVTPPQPVPADPNMPGFTAAPVTAPGPTTGSLPPQMEALRRLAGTLPGRAAGNFLADPRVPVDYGQGLAPYRRPTPINYGYGERGYTPFAR